MSPATGSVYGVRTMTTRSKSDRRRDLCRCGNKRTHTGFGDGVALVGGCELCVRRWVRDGVEAAVTTNGDENARHPR